MKHIPVDQFLFRRSYLDAVSKLPESEKLLTLLSIIEYGLSDCDVWSVTNFEATNKKVFSQSSSQIIDDSLRVRDLVEFAAKKGENFRRDAK